MNRMSLRSNPARGLSCLALLLLMGSFQFFPSTAQAQFESEPVSVILDNTAYQFFADYFRRNTTDVRAGEDSLEIINPPATSSFPGAGLFIEDRNTIIFDYKFIQGNFPENFTMHAFSNIELRSKNLPATGDIWCRESFVTPVGTQSVSWFAEKDNTSTSRVLLDNVRVLSGSQPLPRACSDSQDEPQASGFVAAPAILGFLLAEENDVSTEPGSFFGSFSLPEGVLAGAGGVTYEIATVPIDFLFEGGQFLRSATEITIPEGQSSTDYLIDLFDPDTLFDTKQLSFECLSGCENLDITTEGNWSVTEGVVDFFTATDFSHFANNEVDLHMEAADSLSGTISFPEGVTATSFELIVVRASEAGVFLPASYASYIFPGVGESSWDFKVGAPTDSTAPNWQISVSCISCDESINAATQYPTMADGSSMTTTSEQQFLFPANTDTTNINMTFLTVTP